MQSDMVFYLVADLSLHDCAYFNHTAVFVVVLCNLWTAELDTADDYESDAAGKQADVNCEQPVDTVEQVRYTVMVLSVMCHVLCMMQIMSASFCTNSIWRELIINGSFSRWVFLPFVA